MRILILDLSIFSNSKTFISNCYEMYEGEVKLNRKQISADYYQRFQENTKLEFLNLSCDTSDLEEKVYTFDKDKLVCSAKLLSCSSIDCQVINVVEDYFDYVVIKPRVGINRVEFNIGENTFIQNRENGKMLDYFAYDARDNIIF